MTDAVKRDRRSGIGGSDARIIMSGDQDAIEELWLQKRGENEGRDYSDVLLVQMGVILEDLNCDWFEAQTGYEVRNEQDRRVFAGWERATCTLDGEVWCPRTEVRLGLFEAKFMLPFRWTFDGAIEKYWAQLQHNMLVCDCDKIWISVITGGGGHSYREIEADPFYQVRMLEAEQDFWNCVETGRIPGAPVIVADIMPAVERVDMTGSNAWADAAGLLVAHTDHAKSYESAKKAIKGLMPEGAQEASGYGVTLKRSATGRITVVQDKN
jgi:predicted phage-related endonuclease